MREVFRPKTNFAWASVALLLVFLFAANSFLIVGYSLQMISELVICAILTGLVYAIWIKPKLVLKDDVIEVVNPLKTELIPYREVLSLETKWALTIIHQRGKTKVWVAPATGKQRWIAETKFGWYGKGIVPLTEGRGDSSETMSESLQSSSGQAAYMIRERLKRLS
jgi:hypothetical protein